MKKFTLKNKQCFYLKFKKMSADIEEELLEVLSQNFEFGDEDFIVVEDSGDGSEFMYVFTEPSKVKSVITFGDTKDVLVSHGDVSDIVLTGEIESEKDYQIAMSVEENKEIFDRFLLENLDVDTVLDKMNSGKDLTEVDKKILESINS